MKTTPLILVALCLAGCATDRTVRDLNGWVVHVIDCSGPLLNMGHCVEKAGEVCRTGTHSITVINDDGSESPPPPARSVADGGLPSPSMDFFKKRRLMVRCN